MFELEIKVKGKERKLILQNLETVRDAILAGGTTGWNAQDDHNWWFCLDNLEQSANNT